jgi:hypothetical protein
MPVGCDPTIVPPNPMAVFGDGCGATATLTVEIALTSATGPAALWDVAVWDAGVWGPDTTWVDVSGWVRAVKTSGGRLDQRMRTWQTGRCDVVLHNRDGRFSPDNLDPGAPYVAAGVSGVRPGCAIRVTVTYAAVTYPLFFGYVTAWNEGWALHTPRDGDAYMTVSARDVWGQIAAAKGVAVGAVGAGETFGARVARLLAAAGFTGGVDVETGEITTQATDLSGGRATEIAKTAQSEGGTVFAGPDGTIHGAGRYALVQNARSITVQAAFGDGPGETPWEDIDKAPLSDETIINDAVYARVGGADVRFVDQVSTALYGTRSDPDTADNLVCETDGQVAALAQWAVLTSKDPEARVDGLKFRPRCNLATLGPLFLTLTPMDLVTVTVRAPSATAHIMSRYCFVAGVNHTIENNDWTVDVALASATTHVQFAASRWDVGLWGASDTDPTAARWFV